MSPIEWAHRDLPAEAEMPAEKISIGTRVIGLVLRTVFIASMLLVTVRVGLPQSETIWTAYETPGDLIRLILGFVVCVWLLILLVTLPKDPRAFRTWAYLGLAAAPFASDLRGRRMVELSALVGCGRRLIKFRCAAATTEACVSVLALVASTLGYFFAIENRRHQHRLPSARPARRSRSNCANRA